VASDPLINYHKKKVLIIEDLAEMRSSMKSMLNAMGVQDIETINNGEDALEKIRSDNKYDIIFSDYELGRGKDGQQVLEECRAARLIRAETAFIMVTAAQTVEMVMGALEYEPDGYIAKPVTLDILRTRLNKIIRTKDVYQGINQAIDRRDVQGALEACNRLAVEMPKFALAAYRIKGKVLLDAMRYEEARDIYSTVLNIKRVAWAMLGMAKVHFFTGEYEDARKLLEGLAKTNTKYVEALDWLAKVLEVQGKYHAAQKILEDAVAQSAKSVMRQQALARIAELNNDYEVMFKACRKAIGLGKNSFFRNPGMYISLAKALQPRIKHGSMREQKLNTTEALGLLETARTEFDIDQITAIKAALIEAQTLFNAGKQVEGSMAYRVAQTQLKYAHDLTPDDKLDVYLVKLSFESPEQAKAYGDEILAQIRGNTRLENKFYSVLEASLASQPDERLAMMKRRTEELMHRNDWEEAGDAALRACQFKNADTDIRLMAVRAYVHLFRIDRRDDSKVDTVDEILRQLGSSVSTSDPKHGSYESLKKEWDEVRAPPEVQEVPEDA
jgi:CheY-like chemotaxis protein